VFNEVGSVSSVTPNTCVRGPHDGRHDDRRQAQREINAGSRTLRMNERFAEFATAAIAGSPADFRKLTTDETAKWGKVI